MDNKFIDEEDIAEVKLLRHIKAFEYENGYTDPLLIINSQYKDMLHTIYNLQKKVEQLEEDNRKLSSQLTSEIERSSYKTLQLVLYGALPKPGTPEYDSCGYKDEVVQENVE